VASRMEWLIPMFSGCRGEVRKVDVFWTEVGLCRGAESGVYLYRWLSGGTLITHHYRGSSCNAPMTQS
jgi:hypothetical protein